MAGNTENETLLAALNQQIQAINDLITALSGLTLESTCNCTPEVSFSPTINVAQPTIAGYPVGIAQAGTEGESPPPGFSDPNPATENRKCKAANLVWHYLRDVLHQLDAYGVDQWTALSTAGACTVAGAVLGSAGGPLGGMAGAVIGAVLGLVSYLVLSSVDLGAMVQALDDAQGVFICRLYKSTEASNGKSDAIDAVDAVGGLNQAELAVLDLLLPINVINLLYFSAGPDVERAIDEVDIVVACTGACAEAGADWEVIQGTGSFEVGEQSVLTAEEDENGHYVISLQKGFGGCPGDDTVTIVHDGRTHPAGWSVSAFNEGCDGYTFVQGNGGQLAPDNTEVCGAWVQFLDLDTPGWQLTIQIDEGCE